MLQELKKFRCSHNQLTTQGIPWTTLSLLPKLTHLIADHNRIAVLNPVLCQTSSLCVLHVSANELTELPDDIHLLSALEELDFAENKVQAMPASLGAPLQLSLIHISEPTRPY